MRLFICLALCFSLVGLEPRLEPKRMKTSVIIPCHPAHFHLLENLLECYQNQTSVPDEVVISLSQAYRIPETLQQKLIEKMWRFTLKLLQNNRKVSAGGNRTLAAKHSSGDLLICQDADDLPHPQRVEIIKHLFEHFQIDHLMHQQTFHGEQFTPYRLSELESCCHYWQEGGATILNLVNGPTAITRSVLTQIHWKEFSGIGEDMLFNESVRKHFSHTAILEAALIDYRLEFSTHFRNSHGEWQTKD